MSALGHSTVAELLAAWDRAGIRRQMADYSDDENRRQVEIRDTNAIRDAVRAELERRCAGEHPFNPQGSGPAPIAPREG